MTIISSTHKIQLNRGKRRIWIDGKRLAHARFIGGTHYDLEASEDIIVLTLNDQDGARKVTGRPDGKPIIDIIGKVVSDAFAEYVTHVDVAFSSAGIITIRPAKGE
tara:strand:- start:739 stop:1056 length:318 start_codon:yes stop_codon:yes gene_type:complete